MEKDADLSGMKILVVEDNFLIADVLCEALRGCGCEVVGPAQNVERGEDLVEQAAIDDGRLTGALLDVNLNGQTSFPLASKLRELGVPFIFLTGYGEQGTVPDQFKAARRIAKPYDFDELARLIRTEF